MTGIFSSYAAGHGGPNLWNEGPDPRWGDHRRSARRMLRDGLMSIFVAAVCGLEHQKIMIRTSYPPGSVFFLCILEMKKDVALWCRVGCLEALSALSTRRATSWSMRFENHQWPAWWPSVFSFKAAAHSFEQFRIVQVHSCAFLLAIFAASCLAQVGAWHNVLRCHASPQSTPHLELA